MFRMRNLSVAIVLLLGMSTAALFSGLIHWPSAPFGVRRPSKGVRGGGQHVPAGAAARSRLRSALVLSEADRRFLWDTEHIGFKIERHVFPAWKAAISGGRLVELGDFFAANFTGRDAAGQLRVAYPDASAARLLRDDGMKVLEAGRPEPPVGPPANNGDLSAEAFLQRLAAVRGRFDAGSGHCRASIGLVRLSPLDRDHFDGPWWSYWKVHMAGERSGMPVEATVWLHLRTSGLDENVGDRRKWIEAAELRAVRIVEGRRYLFQEVTADSGIDVDALYDNWRSDGPFDPNTGGVYVADYDQDGVLDLLIDDRLTGPRLYRGVGDGRFVDVTDAAGLGGLRPRERAQWVLSCWADLDNDGDVDLITQDRLFENRGDGTFRDRTADTNLLITPAAGYAVADFDGDGLVDLYVCHSGPYLPGQRAEERVSWIDGGLGIDNVLWRNLGNWQFEDVTRRADAGAGGSSCFTAVWFHANRDGAPDLLAINEFGRNALLVNRFPKPFAVQAIDPVFGGFSMGVTTGDFNNDGWNDLYVANMYSKAGNRILSNVDPQRYDRTLYEKIREGTIGNKLYLNRGDGTFEVLAGDAIAGDVGWAYGANFADFNGDGWLDLYATAGFKSERRGEPDG
ncbi:MAG: VCBS repeat-containing protein [Planctomycetota bacterium]|nr:MAG: VCBS repeat-containing protein [Planctomycetota bacterium]